MTCREKLQLEHPGKIDQRELGGCWGCPHAYGYLQRPEYCFPVQVDKEKMCTACWDREIPGTEEIKKENEIMPTHAINVNTKRTKAELIEEIKLAHEHIREMEGRLERMDKYKQYEECADELKAMHTALINSGFTNEQAFELMKTAIQVVAPSALRGMGL